jgi:hypothetical protein
VLEHRDERRQRADDVLPRQRSIEAQDLAGLEAEQQQHRRHAHPRGREVADDARDVEERGHRSR